jgi:chromosomal replication initiation ATPase DnaA
VGTISQAIAIAAARSGIPARQIMSDCRSADIVRPRHCAMYAAWRAGKSLPVIGKAMGNRDHTTVLHAVRKVERAIAAGEPWTALAVDLEAILAVPSMRFERDNHSREWLRAA